MQKLIDAKRVKLGKYNTTFSSWTLNIWEKKPESKKLKTVWWQKSHSRVRFPTPRAALAVNAATRNWPR